MKSEQSLDLQSLRRAYTSEELTPSALIDDVYARIEARGDDKVWIHRVPREEARAAAEKVAARAQAGEELPLFGIPFALKDNIDVAGMPTTAACPEYAYTPEATAATVQRLLDAGAILIGKTNLDQFATGLVGTRSPYGAPSCVFDPDYISGGSSSGSAVAVAAGLVSFALGTDTAGSGRVPAAFNNLVGWKPTRGLLSNRGLVPACRSLDCMSVFTLTGDDALEIMAIVSAFDPDDSYSRRPARPQPAAFSSRFRFGVPSPEWLEFFGDREAERLYDEAVARLESIGGRKVEVDYGPFHEAAQLLYSGPWVAERLAAITPFIDEHPEALYPVTKRIIEGGRRFSAVDTFRAAYRLEELRRAVEAEWSKMDILLLPTTGTIFTHAEVEAEPVQRNTDLGYYTNFVNLLDLCGVAVPAGFRANGLPFGVSLFAPAFRDAAVCRLGTRLHNALGGHLGGTAVPLPASPPEENGETGEDVEGIDLVVVGAHLSGQPLNGQLTERGAVLVRSGRTRSDYRLYALSEVQPPKPGLVRAPGFSGPGIEVEVWRLDTVAFGDFVAAVPPPLVIGTVHLEDGTQAKGFLCEPPALSGAKEITEYAGWRAYLGALSARSLPGFADRLLVRMALR